MFCEYFFTPTSFTISFEVDYADVLDANTSI
jgi:hypothetical protein